MHAAEERADDESAAALFVGEKEDRQWNEGGEA